jgi:hypothetical protein
MVPLAELYESDFYAWTRRQAWELRRLKGARLNVEVDLDHLVEEVWDLGSSVRDACRSQVERILLQFLKLSYSPAFGPRRSWRQSVVEARSSIENRLTETILKDLRRKFPELYRKAKKVAVLSREEYAEEEAARLLPVECSFTFDDVLRDDWYPEPVVRVE